MRAAFVGCTLLLMAPPPLAGSAGGHRGARERRRKLQLGAQGKGEAKSLGGPRGLGPPFGTADWLPPTPNYSQFDATPHRVVCGESSSGVPRPCRPGEGNLAGYQHWLQPYEQRDGKAALGRLSTPDGWGRYDLFPFLRYSGFADHAKRVVNGSLAVMTAVDFDYRLLAENWYRSTRRAGLEDKAIVYALDKEAHAHLRHKMPTYNGAAGFFASWNATRLERYLQKALAERYMAAAGLVDAGFDVLLTDATHVFVRPGLAEYLLAATATADVAVARGSCHKRAALGCDMMWNFLLLRSRGDVKDKVDHRDERPTRAQAWSAAPGTARARVLHWVHLSLVTGLTDFYLRWWAGTHCMFMGFTKLLANRHLSHAALAGGLTPEANAAAPNGTAHVTLRGEAVCGPAILRQSGCEGCAPQDRCDETLTLAVLPHGLFPLPGAYPAARATAFVGRSARPNRDHRLRLDRYDEKDFRAIDDAMRADGLLVRD